MNYDNIALQLMWGTHELWYRTTMEASSDLGTTQDVSAEMPQYLIDDQKVNTAQLHGYSYIFVCWSNLGMG